MTEPLRLVYLANARIPSEKAHVLQIFKSCEAFSNLGLVVELFYPKRRATGAMRAVSDPFDYYQVERRFELREIRCPDLLLTSSPKWIQAAGFSLQSILFAVLALRKLGMHHESLLYTRDFYVATALAMSRRPFIFEMHTFLLHGPAGPWMRGVARRALGIITITEQLAKECVAAGVARDKILVAPDAVGEERLGPILEKTEARRALGLAPNARIAGYTGHLYRWKGIQTILECAERMPDVTFLIVGGMEDDFLRWRGKAGSMGLGNVSLVPHVAPAQVPLHLAAADVLLLPNSAHTPLSSRHTSPLKAFEYMAAERPVVASNLPSLRELFDHESSALLVRPDDPVDLSDAIRRLLADPDLSARLARTAREKVRSHTWTARTKSILDFARSKGVRVPTPTSAVACGTNP